MIISLSNEVKIYDEGWWIVATTVLPVFANLLRVWTTCRAVVESKPVVGSSKKIIEGLISNYTPIDVLFFSPPETPLITLLPTYVSAHFCRPNDVMICSTCYFFYSADSPINLILAINAKVSLGVNVGKSKSSCITYPIFSPCWLMSLMSVPLT